MMRANLCPDVSHFRFLARAITPPGMPRRFDTRFFVCFTDEVDADPASVRDSDELQDLTWLPIDRHEGYPLPGITKLCSQTFRKRLTRTDLYLFTEKFRFTTIATGDSFVN
jgi:hypothetical protein